METIWHFYQKKFQGKKIEIPTDKSWEYIKNNNKGREDYIAFSQGDEHQTYGETFEDWYRNARVYSALGITSKSKSRILTIMPNVIKTNGINYGANITGAVVDYIDPTSQIDVIKKYIETEGITDIAILNLLYEKNLSKYAEELHKDFGIRNIITYPDNFFLGILPKPLKVILSAKYKFINFDKNIIRFEDAVRSTQNQQIYYDQFSDKLSLITHTSGTTTGIGKPISITDVNRNSLVYQHNLADLVFEPGMKMLHFIPYFAAYGSVNTVHLGMYQGMELIEIPLFKPEDFGKYLIKYKPNIVLGNTPAWMSLLNDPVVQNADLSFLVAAISGGTPTNPSDEENLNNFLLAHDSKCILTKGHGLSELCGCGSYSIDGYNNIGEMGVQMPLTSYLIRDINSNEIIPRELYPAEGEGLISSPNLTSGVLDDKTIFETIEIDGKRYLPTKDIIRINADGTLKFIDRKDRMFPRFDAYNVYPLNIEKLISSLPEIDNCVVTSFFDVTRNGMMPKIYVKFKVEIDNYKEYIYKLIQTLFIDSLDNPYYKANFRDIPIQWVVVDSIPKNTMGKEDIHLIKSKGIDGIQFDIEMNSSNMGVDSFAVVDHV